MKNLRNQTAEQQSNNNSTVFELQTNYVSETNQFGYNAKDKNLSSRLKNFIDNLELSLRRIDAGLM